MNEVRVMIYTFQKMLTTIDLKSFKLLASECLISKLFSPRKSSSKLKNAQNELTHD